MSIEVKVNSLLWPKVRLIPLLNMYISAARGLIATKFYLKHHWGRGLTALGLRPDRTGTLLSMVTGSSHRVIIGEILKQSSSLKPRDPELVYFVCSNV